MTTFLIVSALVFIVGLWIGLGAPGWPTNPDAERRHTERRQINPIAWGRTPGRERPRPRAAGDRQIRLRR